MEDRPTIVRKGAVQINSLTHPFSFCGQLYRMEHRLPQYYGVQISDCASEPEFFGHARLCILDHRTGEVVAQPDASGFVMPSVFVEGGMLYVLASDFMLPSPPYGHKVRVWATPDLREWESWTALDVVEKWRIGSVNVCRAEDAYYMSMEVTSSEEESGGGFAARFARSVDMRHWEVLPAECVYGKDRSCSPHSLRFLDGWFYLFYLAAGGSGGSGGYTTNVTRSRDLTAWQESPLNPVLCPSEEDKQIAHPRLDIHQQAYVRNGGKLGEPNINNSDMKFTEHNGQVIIGYNCGAQSYDYGFAAEAIYDGTEAQFLRAWFPASADR